jgi:3-hydroxymyristoyl/3-hydroxydecanoyl-(acyl carrier protein) dehydratase
MRPGADARTALGAWALDGEGRARGAAVFAADLPVFAGHFPGAPLVPGVYLLAAVAELAGRALGRELEVVEVARAKWSAPALPGRQLAVAVAWRPADGGLALDGTVSDGAVVCATCRLLVAEKRSQTTNREAAEDDGKN